ncbi:MAG: caspase family protein [Byssovorax sp.]
MNRNAVLCLVVVALTGCQREVLPAVAPAPISACLTFVVQEEGVRADAYDRDVQSAVRATTETALVGAGFNVLEDPSQPHDLVARITTVPGSRLETNARVQTRIALESGGKIVATLDASAPQDGKDYDGAIADQLVDAAFRSADLAAFTRELRKPKSKQHLASSALRAAQAPPPAVIAPPPAAIAVTIAPPIAAAPVESALVVGAPQPDAYALVIGVEAYDHAGRVPGAVADAQRFAALAQRTLGVPREHIKLVVGDKADKLAFDLNVEWLKLNVRREGRIYLYFSGRGALRRQTVTEYLLPKDGDPAALEKTSVSLPALLQALAQTRAREVVAFVDAGFSGPGERSAQPADAVAPRVISDPELGPRVALLSAVTSAEVAGSTRDGGGLLTRWLAYGLGTARADLDGDGQITLQELATWAGPRVTREAKRDKRGQSPALLLGPGFAATTTIVTGLPADQ